MIARVAVALLALTAARDDPLAGRVPGPATDCIDLDRVDGPDIRDARTILYRQNRGRIWRADLAAACRSLQPFSTIVVEVYGRRLCRNDRFRVRTPDSTILGGYCRFGAFTPFDLPPRR